MRPTTRTARTTLLALALTGTAVGTALSGPAAADPQTVSRQVTGLVAGGTALASFSTSDVGVVTTQAVTGIPAGQALVAIDYRPATGGLYGVTDAADGQRLFLVDPASGVATQVGSAPFANVAGEVSIDFNPTVDRLRVISSEGANLRVNPNNGARGDITMSAPSGDGALNYAGVTATGIAAAAYTNNDNDCLNVAPATSCTTPAGTTGTGTTLYDLDATLDQLVTQVPPNAGTLNGVGGVEQDLGLATGFDIHSPLGGGNEAFASLSKNGKSRLFVIDLATGFAQPAGKIGADVVDIALPIGQGAPTG